MTSRWNIDRAVALLEDSGVAGTAFTRVLMDVPLVREKKLTVTAAERQKEAILVWCLTLGKIMDPKAFFYGRTIREAFLRARKAVRKMSKGDLLVLGLKGPRKKPKVKAR